MTPQIEQAIRNDVAQYKRRVIGPVPPRDEKGKYRIRPILGEQVKINRLGEPVRDKDGQPILETVDQRNRMEYLTYEPGHERQIAEGATKGLSLFRVDLAPEPLYYVYARNPSEAKDVFLREAGITRLAGDDPKVSSVQA